ncbi:MULTISPECIES: hypothetical protein [Flavobacterium]|jgi:hypothetical protein|uniref:Uncharacterized protein n=1 Tax=Flavobacterium chungnamense TaxID=706182 RepID=A0ABP7UJ26_9FLAO
MKTLRKINNIAFYTTLTLFITLYLGMLAQIPLGIIQVISAIILTYITYLKSRYAKKHLTIYWFATITELTLLYLEQFYYQSSNDFIELTLMVLFPMSIAIYFFIIMRKITSEYELKKINL